MAKEKKNFKSGNKANTASFKTEAMKTYKEKQASIRASIKALQEKLTTHEASFKTNPKNWGFVGDIGYIDEELKKVLGLPSYFEEIQQYIGRQAISQKIESRKTNKSKN